MKNIHKNYALVAIVLGALAVSSCAKKADSITASYVSPLAYEPYTCEQIQQEAARISTRAQQVSGIQDKKAKQDAGAMAVGLILFWPAMLAIKGNDANEVEVARLKGEMETIEKVAIQKNCGIQFNQTAPST